jgi:hypothetical protein
LKQAKEESKRKKADAVDDPRRRHFILDDLSNRTAAKERADEHRQGEKAVKYLHLYLSFSSTVGR